MTKPFGPWIEHDDSGWPKGLEPDEVVIVELEDGYVTAPIPACSVGWHWPGDAVVRYRRCKPFDVAFFAIDEETVG